MDETPNDSEVGGVESSANAESHIHYPERHDFSPIDGGSPGRHRPIGAGLQMRAGEKELLRHCAFGATRVTDDTLAGAPFVTRVGFYGYEEFCFITWLRLWRRAMIGRMRRRRGD